MKEKILPMLILLMMFAVFANAQNGTFDKTKLSKNEKIRVATNEQVSLKQHQVSDQAPGEPNSVRILSDKINIAESDVSYRNAHENNKTIDALHPNFGKLQPVNGNGKAASEYNVYYATGYTYTEITGGTVSSINGSTEAENIALPFSFIYDNVTYTTARISRYGWLEMGQTYTSSGSSNDLASTTMKPFLCPLWDQLAFITGSEVRYQTFGTSPNRYFIVQWKNMRWGSGSGETVNFQVWIFETTREIYFFYGANNATSATSASIGINDATGGSSHFISMTPGDPPSYNTSTANNSISTGDYPGSGVIYIFKSPTIYTFPWKEDFENGGDRPDDWTEKQEFGTVDWAFQDGGQSGNPASAHSGDYNAFFYYSSTAGYTTKLITPSLDLSGLSNPVLSFYHTQAVYSGDQDELKVYYKTSYSGTWTLIKSWTTNYTAWTKEVVSLPNKSSEYYIAFEGIAKYGYGVCIDDVGVCEGKITDFPWHEGFENNDTLIPCSWNEEYVTGTTEWIASNGGHNDGTNQYPDEAHLGNYNVQFYSSTTGRTTKLVSPTLDISGEDNPVVSFYHTQKVNGTSQDQLKLYYKTSSSGTWTLLQTWSSDIPNWKREIVNLPSKSSDYYIAFEGISGGGYGVCVDDVRIGSTKQWTGSAKTSDWGTAGNWSPSGVPASTDDVIIPSSGVTTMPVMDETASCHDLQIMDGASVTVNTGTLFTIGGDLYIGTGTSGVFEVSDGRTTINGNMYCVKGSVFNIDGGILNITNWMHDPGDNWVKGSFELTGGTVTASESVFFSITDISGSMEGTFALNVGADLYLGSDTTSTGSPIWTMTGGTITMKGTGTPALQDHTFFCESPNPSYYTVAPNLVIDAAGQNYHLSHSGHVHGVYITNNFTVSNGSAYTHAWNKATSDSSFYIGGTLSVSSGATFVHADIPAAKFSVDDFSLNANSNYIYDITSAQTLFYDPDYGNLTVQGSATCTADGDITVQGDFTANGHADFNDHDCDIDGDATIASGGEVSGGTGTITVKGDWTDNGTFTYETSTVEFAGTTDSDLSGSVSDDITTQYSSYWKYVACYFDIKASGGVDISINSFDINADSTATVNVQIWYYRNGSYTTHHSSSTNWIQLGTTQSVTAQDANNPTHVDPGASVTIPADSTYAFFISCYDNNGKSRILYSAGVDTTYKDLFLTIDVGGSDNSTTPGVGTAYYSNDDRWNGTVYYSGTKKFLPFYDMDVSKTGKAGSVNMKNHVDVNHNLTISTSNTLNVNPGYYLNVDGTLTNNAGNTGLYIKSDIEGTANMIHNTNNVHATVERYIEGSSTLNANDYHFVSLPLTSSNNPLSGLFMWSYLFSFDESSYDWDAWGGNTTLPMDVTEGYMIFYPNLGGNSPADTTYSLAGTINNGSFSAKVSYTSSASTPGFNLVPNPYPSSIDWDASSGWTKTNINNSVWIWSPDDGNYASYISGTGTNGATRYIPIGQSFFVQASASSPALSMTNDVRVFSDQEFFKNKDKAVEGLLRLKTSGNGFGDELIVRFDENATNDYDGQYDAAKMYGSDGAPQLYTKMGAQKYSINTIPYTDEQFFIPLGYEMAEPGTYTFTFEDLESIDQSVDIDLEDLLTGIIQDLRKDNTYSFAHNPANEPLRFKLHFNGVTSIDETVLDPNQVYFANGQLYVNLPSFDGKQVTIEIFNVAGQTLFSTQFRPDGLTAISTKNIHTKGIYLVRVSDSEKSIARKVAW